MKTLRKLLFFLSIFLFYIIIRELVSLYVLMRSLHPWAGYLTLILIVAFVVYFALLPLFKILRLPKNPAPVKNVNQEEALIRKRMQLLRNNPRLKESGIDLTSYGSDKAGYISALAVVKPECEAIRKRYVVQLFYSTSIVQNGFVDAILILSSSINLIKDTFILYNGRVSNKDLYTIGRMVYYSIAIGGSEGVEHATEEMVSRLASDSMKNIPFIEKILGSIADGFVNAALLTRISFITENYCTMTVIESEKDLYPSFKFVNSAVKNITSDIIDRLKSTLKKITIEKPAEYAMIAVNPVKYVFTKADSTVTEKSGLNELNLKDAFKDTISMIFYPIGFGVGKLMSRFKKG